MGLAKVESTILVDLGRDFLCVCCLRAGGERAREGERLLLSAINSVCMRITSCNSVVAKFTSLSTAQYSRK